MSLTASGVSYAYSGGTSFAQPALAGVSLVVEPGELVLVLGATGSGKSTLLRLCAGLLAPSEGTVRIDGVSTTGPAAGGLRGRVGLVFQRPESQLFAETLLEDAAFGPRNLGASAEVAAERARVALAAVGLDPDAFGDRSPFTLSGGEARRAAIAGVLAMAPAYLLLDEPTAGLDAAGRASVQAAMQAAREEAGVVVVTHDPEEFLGEADAVLVLAEGCSAFVGHVAELLADPTPLTEAGLEAPPVLAAQLLARERGFTLPLLTLDPALAADTLAAARRDLR